MVKYIKVSDIKKILGTIINDNIKKGQVILDKPDNTLTHSDKQDLIRYRSVVIVLGTLYTNILSDEEFLSRIGTVVDIPDEKPATKPKNRFAEIDIVMESKVNKKKRG